MSENFNLPNFNANPKKKETTTLLSKIAPFPYRNMAELEKGFAFIYRSNFDKDFANDECEIYLQTTLDPHTSEKNKKYVKQKQLFDKVLVFEKYETYEYDYCTYTTLFFISNDKVYCYDYMGDYDEMKEMRITIQGLVPLDELLFARELIGKKAPIAISNWMMLTNYGVEEYESWNSKIEEVTIINVGYGEQDTPIRIVFEAQNKNEYFVDVCISSTNTTNYVEDPEDRPTGFIDDVLNVKPTEKVPQEIQYNYDNNQNKIDSVQKSFIEIKKNLNNFAPKIVASLNPPVSAESIEKLEQLVGKTLPESFWSVYKIHNGIDNESENSSNFFYALTWFSIEETIRWYEERIEYYDKTIAVEVENADPKIFSKDAQTLAWIPIAWDSSRCFLFLDTNPTDKGNNGQIIFYDSEYSQTICVASSMEMLLTEFVLDLERGLYKIDEEAKEDGEDYLQVDDSIDIINQHINKTRWN